MGPGWRLTSEVALLSERDPQVVVLPAEAVCEEGGEGGHVLPQELPPPRQLLQGQGRGNHGAGSWDRGGRRRPTWGELRGPEMNSPSPISCTSNLSILLGPSNFRGVGIVPLIDRLGNRPEGRTPLLDTWQRMGNSGWAAGGGRESRDFFKSLLILCPT